MKTIITSSKPARAHDDTAVTCGSADQRALPEISYTMFRCQQVFWHVVFHAAIKRAVQLVGRCWASIKSLSQDGGHAGLILSICTPKSGLDVQSTNIPGNTSHQMQNTTKNIAPDASATGTTTTPAIILQGLIGMFSEPGAKHADRTAALELDLLLMLDASAERDLLIALGIQNLNVSTPAGLQHMMDVLATVGAVQQKIKPNHAEPMWIRFTARPLLDILKAMPHREGGMGFPRELVEKHLGTAN